MPAHLRSRSAAPAEGRSTDAADYQRVPRPVAAMPKTFPDRASTGWHAHERAQLLFALRGAMAVDTHGARWVVPPQRALWVPPGTPHRVTMRGRVDMRTLYLEPPPGLELPLACAALEVTPLARELIARAAEMPLLYDEHGADGLVVQLLLAELARLRVLPLWLPLPQRPALAQLCERWLADPATRTGNLACAAALAVSERTFTRWFAADTGLTFGQWCQRARLLEAVDRLTEGESVISVALDLGYESPSAFAAMFRRALGMTPSAVAGKRRGLGAAASIAT